MFVKIYLSYVTPVNESKNTLEFDRLRGSLWINNLSLSIYSEELVRNHQRKEKKIKEKLTINATKKARLIFISSELPNFLKLPHLPLGRFGLEVGLLTCINFQRDDKNKPDKINLSGIYLMDLGC